MRGKCASPRGTLPIRAETSQELGHHGHAGEAESRGVGQLVEEVMSGEDPGEYMKGFPGGSVEGAGDEANALIEHELGPCAKGAVFAGGSPQLAAIR